MRYFRDGVLKMIIKKVLPGDGNTGKTMPDKNM